MIMVDDLNDWIGCLGGHPQAITPHMDALASRGVLFTEAHCVAPACRPRARRYSQVRHHLVLRSLVEWESRCDR